MTPAEQHAPGYCAAWPTLPRAQSAHSHQDALVSRGDQTHRPHRYCRPAPHPRQEFARGKHLLSGEYVLPSGTALPLGAMISKLKRAQMLVDVTGGGEAREK